MPESSLPSGAAVAKPYRPSSFGSEIMATATINRAQRQAYIVCSSSLAPMSPPDFGPEVAPAESAAAGQTVRVVKDILHVGRHKVGYDAAGKEIYWDVTPATLAQILADFKAAKAIKASGNLGKTHGDADLLIHPDDLIAPIDELKLSGNALWMSAYVTPEQRDYLKNPARLVSPAIIPNHVRAGQRFAQFLTHVAVTDRPVLSNQTPFLAMADTKGGSMNPELLDAINMLMEAAGLAKLGDIADETDLVSQLKGVAAAMGKSAAPAEPAAEPAPVEGGMPGLDMGMEGMPKGLADHLKAQNKLISEQSAAIKALSDKVAGIAAEKANAAKVAFNAKAAELVAAGVPKVTVDGKIKLADSIQCYDLALLDGLVPVLNTGRTQAHKLADAAAPKIGGDDHEERRKIAAQGIAARRGISLEQAMKFVP